MAKRRRSRGLGSTSQTHVSLVDGALHDAHTRLRAAENAAKRGSCEDVWDHLVAVEGRIATAEAHLASASGSNSRQHADVMKADAQFHLLKDTLGMRCLRR